MSAAWQLAGRNLVVQSLLIVLAGMLLDGGVALRFVVLASLCWWLAAAFPLLRRGDSLTRVDRFWLEGGFIVALAVSGFSAPAWGWLRAWLGIS